MKAKNGKLVARAVLGAVFLMVLFLSTPNLTEAKSLVCKKYEHFKDKYKNHEDELRYNKTQWLKNHEQATYDYYKLIYNSNRYLTDLEFNKLSPRVKNVFLQYYGFVGYRNYLLYKHKCHNGDSETCGDSSEGLSSEKKIISFSLPLFDLEGKIIAAVDGDINEVDHLITFNHTWPSFLIHAGMKPAIEISSKATISPDSGAVRDFFDPLVYTVTAEDGSTQGYTVTVDHQDAQ